MAFTCSGSEAVQLALRLARAYVDRNLVVKFEGHYHGWMDSVLVSYHPRLEEMGPVTGPYAVPASRGQEPGFLSDVLVCPWHRPDVLGDLFAQNQGKIAAVIMEPVLCNSGCLLPRDGYLQTVRDLCTDHGAVLIFDEVITGFRMAPGGAQSYYGIQPDLATLGKALAGGLPMSAVVGPVNTTTGPDGALYVVDFYRKVVEHPEFVREEFMHDHELFYSGTNHGRIYRIVHESQQTDPWPRLDRATSQELVDHLSHRNKWWRITAQRLLVQRQDQLAGLLSPQQLSEVQDAAVEALIGQTPVPISFLLEKWSSYTVSRREAVLDALFENPDHTAALLDALESGRVQPGSLHRSRQRQLLRLPDSEMRARAASLVEAPANSRKETIEKYRSAVINMGNPVQGKEVFARQCSKCHKVGSSGFEVGPDLLSLTNRAREDLLANIIDPNANIVPGYEEYRVDTRDGRIITGVLSDQNANSVTLGREEGEQDKILRANIAALRPSTVSAMPEGVEEEITVEEMTDLLGYLKSLGTQDQ